MGARPSTQNLKSDGYGVQQSTQPKDGVHCDQSTPVATLFTFGNNYHHQTSVDNKREFVKEPTGAEINLDSYYSHLRLQEYRHPPSSYNRDRFCWSNVTHMSCSLFHSVIVLNNRFLFGTEKALNDSLCGVVSGQGLQNVFSGGCFQYIGHMWNKDMMAVKSVITNVDCTCILYDDCKTIQVCGYNVYGKLFHPVESGLLPVTTITVPDHVKEQVCGDTGGGGLVTHLLISNTFSIVVFDGRWIYASGRNLHGECGFGENGLYQWHSVLDAQTSSFRTSAIEQGIKFVASGLNHTIWTLGDESVWTSGLNRWGQLGIRKDETGGSPVKCLIQKESYKTVTAVACGSEFTTIILDECKLYVFGRLSARNFTCHPLLVTIPLMSRELLTGVHCGAEHAILVTNKGHLFSSGSNSDFQTQNETCDLEAFYPLCPDIFTSCHEYPMVSSGSYFTAILRTKAGSMFSSRDYTRLPWSDIAIETLT